jgi:hypothetical protein
MLPDATFEPAPPRQRKLRLRFSLLALLIFVTLICFGLAWLVQPTLVEATALFHVDRVKPTLLGDETRQSRDEQNFEIVKKTQIALLKSYFVLNAALRSPGVSGMPILRSQMDPVEWLQEHLEVEFPENAEILAIRLRGPEAQAQDLAQIVDAVAKAYRDEVIYAGKQRRLASRDLLARSLESLNKEIARKFEQYLDIAREADRLEGGSGKVLQELDIKRLDRVETEIMRLENEQFQAETKGGSENAEPIAKRIEQLRERQAELEQKITSRAERSVELTTRQRELDQLQRIADEMSIKLEKMDIEANAPERIRQIQPAVVGPAK